MAKVMKGRRALEVLLSRAAWVRSIIDERRASPGALGHYAQELAALDWALPILGDLVARESDSAVNVHRQRVEAELCICATRALVALHRAGEHGAFARLIADAPQAIVGRVECQLFGARVPDAAPTGGAS